MPRLGLLAAAVLASTTAVALAQSNVDCAARSRATRRRLSAKSKKRCRANNSPRSTERRSVSTTLVKLATLLIRGRYLIAWTGQRTRTSLALTVKITP